VRPRHFLLLLLAAALLPLTGCETTTGGVSPSVAAAIAGEAPGNYYIGRRFHIPHTHFWGYLRSPGQDWSTARLVIMQERFMKIPNRLPEQPTDGGYAYGDDHNTEYRM
jgi:hypothetical protein